MDISVEKALAFALITAAASDAPPAQAERALIMNLLNTTSMEALFEEALFDEVMTLLSAPEPIQTMLGLIAPHHHYGAYIYAQTAEFIARNGVLAPEEMRFLELLADELQVSRLDRAAIDYSAHIRHQMISQDHNE